MLVSFIVDLLAHGMELALRMHSWYAHLQDQCSISPSGKRLLLFGSITSQAKESHGQKMDATAPPHQIWIAWLMLKSMFIQSLKLKDAPSISRPTIVFPQEESGSIKLRCPFPPTSTDYKLGLHLMETPYHGLIMSEIEELATFLSMIHFTTLCSASRIQ